MNILYITQLPQILSTGPIWSVPASIAAQSKIDNCLWINTSDVFFDHWGDVNCYHNVKDFCGKFDICKMPEPFNKPDVVVFEDFYELNPVIIARQLRKEKIPYIIVPRGAFSKEGQNNRSKWKKKIANFVIFNQYANNAIAIQYLAPCDIYQYVL